MAAETLKAFLEETPPGTELEVTVLAQFHEWNANMVAVYQFEWPLLELHCDADTCGGKRFFQLPVREQLVTAANWTKVFVRYSCRNCRNSAKTFAVAIKPLEEKSIDTGLRLLKYGEYPPFGPPTPARVISLLGPEKDYFLKGRRAENQGMGIAAFAYYRRVVENQKNRLLDEIIRVATKIGATSEMIADLNQAKAETQFSKAVDSIKHGIPSGLLIEGHNPLTLLHSALSEGLHAQTDEDCLAQATAIRVVLADLADRIGHALKDRAELGAALTKLMNRS